MPTGPELFCDAYPASPLCATSLPACQLCHTTAPVRNSFGESVSQMLLTEVSRPLTQEQYSGGLEDALKGVEGIDSDVDGHSNLDEILAGSLPGDSSSSPGEYACPLPDANPQYAVCNKDRRYQLRKMMIDVCGHSPELTQLEALDTMSELEQKDAVHSQLDVCLDSEFWMGKNGELWQLANRKIRPLGSFKGGPEDAGFLAVADYYNDYRLFAWTQIDDHDAREAMTAQYFVAQDGPTDYRALSAAEEDALFVGAGTESVERQFRAGMMTTRWNLLYTIMFSVIPRSAAALAYRAFLRQDIGRMEGLMPIPGEPRDLDQKGVAQAGCRDCHSTLDPLAYAFQNYNGFGPAGGRASYVPNRMQFYDQAGYPGIAAMGDGYVFDQQVPDLMTWASVAADSEQFARATVTDYWILLMGENVRPEYSEEFANLWQRFMTDNSYGVERMLHELIETEAYSVP